MNIETRYQRGSIDYSGEFVSEGKEEYFLSYWDALNWLENRRDAPEWTPAIRETYVLVDVKDKVYICSEFVSGIEILKKDKE